MSVIAVIVAGFAVLIAFTCWLPPLVVRLRMRIFTRINGEESLQLPNAELGAEEFMHVYAHPAADGRSAGAALSDLFWYWLSPGPEMHQEHIENGPRYEKVADFTRKTLARPRLDVEALLEKHTARCLNLRAPRRWRIARLRDLLMPMWAGFFYELVFEEECPEGARALIAANAGDVATALKCCGLRHMSLRRKLTAFLCSKLQAGALPRPFPEGFTLEEQAHYLQCTYFTTAVVQMSEALTHLLVSIAQHESIQRQLVRENANRQLVDNIINESLRLNPLFGIAHRIISNDVRVKDHVIRRGSVVCFNYPAFHRLDVDEPESFKPDRWEACPMKAFNHIPFGVLGNRPCPARTIALVAMRRFLFLFVETYRVATSVAHSRSLANRGPCLIVARREAGLSPTVEKLLLLGMRMRDQWEDAWRSVAQLFYGTIMVIHARRLRLCQRHFESGRAGATQSGRFTGHV